jgi:hypothetical protein
MFVITVYYGEDSGGSQYRDIIGWVDTKTEAQEHCDYLAVLHAQVKEKEKSITPVLEALRDKCHADITKIHYTKSDERKQVYADYHNEDARIINDWKWNILTREEVDMYECAAYGLDPEWHWEEVNRIVKK